MVHREAAAGLVTKLVSKGLKMIKLAPGEDLFGCFNRGQASSCPC